jgi:hypothetical protein
MADQAIGVLHGKVLPIDETFSQMTNGEHLYTIPDSLTKAFQSAGLETPWDETQPSPKQGNQNANQPKPQNTVPVGTFAIRNQQGQVAGYKDAQGNIKLFNQ